jgi:hypothetical protein
VNEMCKLLIAIVNRFIRLAKLAESYVAGPVGFLEINTDKGIVCERIGLETLSGWTIACC